MRANVVDLKQKLEVGEISKYCWVQDEQMLADILTKDKKEKHGLDEVLRDNKLKILKSEGNCVKFVDGEIEINGRKLREKLTKIPFRKKMERINPSQAKKKEEEEKI